MPEQGRTFQFVADRGDARLRLDRILVRRITDVSRLSRTIARGWVEAGLVTVDGRAARRPALRVEEGARIEVALPSSTRFRARPEAEPSPLDVLYEDDTCLVINKAPGVTVHPSYKQPSGTLLNAVLWHVRERPAVRPGIVTRLDRDTSGIVLVALDAGAHRVFARDGAARLMQKRYAAVVRGWPRPRAGSLRAPLGRDPSDRRRMIVSPDGAAADTRYAVVREYEHQGHGEALVECELLTGRTHQIRVHLAAAGWPIVGDRVYGIPDARIARQALHAHRLSLLHPRTRQPIEVEAPLPEDMQRLVDGSG
jgi:23S rRNA pseudouridine1911/1915/1917 synthase